MYFFLATNSERRSSDRTNLQMEGQRGPKILGLWAAAESALPGLPSNMLLGMQYPVKLIVSLQCSAFPSD